jgi:hypothetical protein
LLGSNGAVTIQSVLVERLGCDERVAQRPRLSTIYGRLPRDEGLRFESEWGAL